MKRVKRVALALVASALLIGCDPESVSVDVPLSAIERVKTGQTVYVEAEVVYSVDSSSQKEVPRIKAAIERHFGSAPCRVAYTPATPNGRLRTTFLVPLSSSTSLDGLDARDQAAPFMLVYDRAGGKLSQVLLRRNLSRLNSRLSDISLEIEADLGAGPFTFRLLNDIGKSVSATSYAAWVDGAPIPVGKTRIGEMTTILFNKGTSNTPDFWHEEAPFILLGE